MRVVCSAREEDKKELYSSTSGASALYKQAGERMQKLYQENVEKGIPMWTPEELIAAFGDLRPDSAREGLKRAARQDKSETGNHVRRLFDFVSDIRAKDKTKDSMAELAALFPGTSIAKLGEYFKDIILNWCVPYSQYNGVYEDVLHDAENEGNDYLLAVWERYNARSIDMNFLREKQDEYEARLTELEKQGRTHGSEYVELDSAVSTIMIIQNAVAGDWDYVWEDILSFYKSGGTRNYHSAAFEMFEQFAKLFCRG